jgi:hypothetical protein
MVRRAQAALGFQFHQGLGVDGLDLGHHQVGLLVRDQVAQRGRVEHVQRVAAMGHLHGRRVVVAIGGNHFHAQALQLDRHFLAQLARTQKEHAAGVGRQRRAQGDGAGVGHGGHGCGWRGAHCSQHARPHGSSPAGFLSCWAFKE